MRLQPTDDLQRLLQQRALQILASVADERWLLVEKTTTAIPTPFLIPLIFWLAVLFASLGLFALHNGTILIALLLCALSISGGIYTIGELADSTHGIGAHAHRSIKGAVRMLGTE